MNGFPGAGYRRIMNMAATLGHWSPRVVVMINPEASEGQEYLAMVTGSKFEVSLASATAATPEGALAALEAEVESKLEREARQISQNLRLFEEAYAPKVLP